MQSLLDSIRRPAHLCALAGVLAMTACTRNPATVRSSVPVPGQANVDTRTVIAVFLSNTMSASDVSNTDAVNFVVTGDQTEGVYSGSIQATNRSRIFAGQTVEQFQQGVGRDLLPPDPSGDPPEEEGDDTLVFLLDPGVEFKPGEVVSVRISDRVTVRGVPLPDAISFTFTVVGGADRAGGDFFVTATAPATTSANVGVTPVFRASLSEAAEPDSLTDNVVVRGSISGFHIGGATAVDNSDPEAPALTHVLAVGDHLEPGEIVTVALKSEISSASASLAAFLARFQVRPGRVSAGWIPKEVPADVFDVVAVLPGNFLPATEGVELVVATRDALFLYRLTPAEGAADGAAWMREAIEVTRGFELRGAVAIDPDDDGVPQIVALLQSDLVGGGLLQEYSATEDGTLETSGTPSPFEAESPDGLFAGDFDADGQVELFVTHDEGEFVPVPPGVDPDDLEGVEIPPESTGHLTIFELGVGLPPGDIDFGDLENLLEVQFTPQRRVIPGFERSRGIGLEDLDNDGRLDLINVTVSGLVLYRNQSTTESPSSFRRVGTLAARDGNAAQPNGWVALDAGDDGDLDIVTWDDAGALLYENRYADDASTPSLPDDSDDGVIEPHGLLFELVTPVDFSTAGVNVLPGDRVLAANIDGDSAGLREIVVGRSGGETIVLIAGEGDTFTAHPLGGEMSLSGLAFADTNGDTGLDVVTITGDSAVLYETDPADVIAPPFPEPVHFFLECAVDGSTGECVVDENGFVDVVVRGDLTRAFTGYSISLDYDQADLDYVGFTPPVSFEQTATFSICPNVSGVGCSGFATASMTYRENTIGAPLPDVELGVFRFRVQSVEVETVASIAFSSFDAGGRSFANILTVNEEGISRDVPVGLLGDPIEITLLPPPPPGLVIQCGVEERRATSALVRVEWRSELLRFDSIDLDFTQGEFELHETRDWDDGSGIFEISFPGVISVSASAERVDGEGDGPEQANCEVINVFRPTISGCAEGQDGAEIVWSMAHDVDSFNIYKNDIRFDVVPGSDDELIVIDSEPSEDGGDLYEVSAVLRGVEGLRDRCSGNDPDPCVTEDPREVLARLDSRFRPSAPNVVRFRWSNGEAYDELRAFLRYEPLPSDIESIGADLFGEGGLALDSTQTELVWDGDPDRGGALPGSYTLSLEGRNATPELVVCVGGDTVPSQLVTLETVNVPIPELSTVSLRCLRDGVSDVLVTWSEAWRGFDSRMTLTARHTVDESVVSEDEIVVRDVLLSDTSHRFVELAPIGSWDVTLAATHVATVDADILTTSCGPIAFSPTLTTGRVEVPLGQASFEIPILGSGVFGPVVGYELDLEFPEEITIEGFEEVEADERGRKTVHLTGSEGLFVDPDPDGDGRSSGDVIITTVTARVSADATDLVGTDPQSLDIDGASLTFAGSDDSRGVNSVDGQIEFRGRWVMVEEAETVAGSDEALRIALRLSFEAPDGFPEYRFNGFQIHIEWDPSQLEMLPFREEDLVDTILRQPGEFDENEDGRLGEVFPALDQVSGDLLETINTNGDFNLGWLSFPALNPLLGEEFLRPVTDGELIVCRFRSKLPSSSVETFAPIRFVVETNDPSQNRTSFFPDRDVPGVRPMDAFFDGGVLVHETEGALDVTSMQPSRGPITGGNTVTIRGRGLDGGAGVKPTIRMRDFNGDVVAVPQESVLPDEIDGSREVSFVVPDGLAPHDGQSARRTLPPTQSLAFNVEVDNGLGTVSAGTYFYQSPALAGVDVSSVRSSGGDILRLSGTGFSQHTRVEIHPDGFDPVEASLLAGRPFDESGTSLVIVSPVLPGPADGETFRSSRLVVRFDDVIEGLEPVAVLTLEDTIRILPSDGEPPSIHVDSIDPASGVRCEDTAVVIRGSGFTESTRVKFGSVDADVVFDSSLELRVIASSVPTAGSVVVEVSDLAVVAGGGPHVFDYENPPDFVRGDADGSGGISVADATLLASLVLGESSALPPNRDALDANDDGAVNLSDVIGILGYLFGGRGPLPEPFGDRGESPGQDPSDDDICY